MTVGIIGLGNVGHSMYKSFKTKDISCKVYDKYKGGGIGNIEACLECNILFLALPTPYSEELLQYDRTALCETCEFLATNCFNGLVVIKSTVEPGTTSSLFKTYGLNFCHNPEFLSCRTRYEDFQNQSHIVLGKESHCKQELFDEMK